MRQDLDDYLCNQYPRMFKDRNGPVHSTCMCWGFGHADGWFNIIDMLCACIDEHVKWKRESRARDLLYNRRLKRAIKHNDYQLLINPKIANNEYHIKECEHVFNEQKYRDVTERVEHVVVEQVKEKFGSLRFYYRGGDSVVDGMVRMAEMMSSVTCEVCGKPGKMRGGGWIKTLCDEHAKKENDD